jgi:sodium transport system permease protein
LPFLIMIFLSVGSLHSAVEISVGEKIANTLEPLLITPVHRWELAIGKYFVVFAVTVFVTIGGVFSTLFSTALISGDSAVQGLDFESGVSGLLLILPSAAAVAGLFLAISMAARSTREAHIWITPLNFMLITAGLAPRLFGTQLSWTTVLIPFVNVSVMSGQLLSRSLPVEYYVGATFSSVLFALFCIAIVVRQFHREDVLFRT